MAGLTLDLVSKVDFGYIQSKVNFGKRSTVNLGQEGNVELV